MRDIPASPKVRTLQVTAANANVTLAIPAGYTVLRVTMRNTTANAVTGGIRVGTSDGGAQVITAQALGASITLGVADSDLLLRYHSKTSPTTWFIQAVTSWNSASVVIGVVIAQVENAP
jgi:hypothetical protein